MARSLRPGVLCNWVSGLVVTLTPELFMFCKRTYLPFSACPFLHNVNPRSTGSIKLCLFRVKSYPHSVFSKVQTCTKISLVSLMLRRVLRHAMTAMTSWILPMTLCVWMIVVVHVKVVSVVSDHKTPTFSLPTLRAAQGSALDWPVPVYPGKRHVLLVKVVIRPVNVKL